VRVGEKQGLRRAERDALQVAPRRAPLLKDHIRYMPKIQLSRGAPGARISRPSPRPRPPNDSIHAGQKRPQTTIPRASAKTLKTMQLSVILPSHSAQKARHCDCGGHGVRRITQEEIDGPTGQLERPQRP
jgi:hypothetical protein